MARKDTDADQRKKDRDRSFAVIGLGSFGAMVATELARFGNAVLGADRDRTIVNRLSEKLSQAVILDSRDEAALREAGIAEVDVALVAMAEDLESSVLTAVNLKMIGVKEVWAKAENRSHHRILSKLGVDRVIHPEEEMGRHIAQMLHNPLVRDYVSVGNNYHVVNITVPDSVEGRKLADLQLMKRFELRCIAVMRGTEYLGDSDSENAITLQCDDKMLILGDRQSLHSFAAAL